MLYSKYQKDEPSIQGVIRYNHKYQQTIFVIFVLNVLKLSALQLGLVVIALRQTMTLAHLLGRVNASRRFLVFGIMPLAALLSGLLGSMLGLRSTLVIGAGGLLFTSLLAFFSSVRQVHSFPRDQLV